MATISESAHSISDGASLNISDISGPTHKFLKVQNKDPKKQFHSRGGHPKSGITVADRQINIFIFDNASMMDEESYSLFLRLYNSVSSLCLIMIVGQDTQGNPEMPFLDKTKSPPVKKPGLSSSHGDFIENDDAELAKLLLM
mmetsp:Transcript_37080/g.56890  ORF Transcript_37080/g.56890 Transcript_37080/m.56890 type:complete len:142 (+) Transcript_37080:2479-2904(+)